MTPPVGSLQHSLCSMVEAEETICELQSTGLFLVLQTHSAYQMSTLSNSKDSAAALVPQLKLHHSITFKGTIVASTAKVSLHSSYIMVILLKVFDILGYCTDSEESCLTSQTIVKIVQPS